MPDPSAPKQTLPNTPAPQTGGVIAPPPPAPPRPAAPPPVQAGPAPAPRSAPVSSGIGPSYGGVPNPGVDTADMDGVFRQRLMAMVAASGGRLNLVSGFRSHDLQQKLWDKALAQYGSAAVARQWVAPPGNSNHEKGIAADLGGDIAWAHAHAAEFGLYFPMSWEPWHIEPVGSRGGSTTWAGPKASAKGYTTPVQGYSLNPDPSKAENATTADPRMSLGFQLASFGSLLESPTFANGGPPQLPDVFSTMPNGTA